MVVLVNILALFGCSFNTTYKEPLKDVAREAMHIYESIHATPDTHDALQGEVYVCACAMVFVRHVKERCRQQ